jgi:hypothetical protein
MKPCDLAKDLMRPYALKGWHLGDQKLWDCYEYKARIGELTIAPFGYAIVILRIKSDEHFEVFHIAELLKELRDEQKVEQLALW